MELQQLRYFAIAAKYQHITRAANELHVAQPAVSGTIKRLENELADDMEKMTVDIEKTVRKITELAEVRFENATAR